MIMAVIMALILPITPQEELLKAKMPGIFEASRAHYRALLKKVSGEARTRTPKRFQNNKIAMVGPHDWCSGFFAGSLWYLYEQSNDEFWKKAACEYTEALMPSLETYHGDHDIGFRAYCSAGNGYRLTRNPRYADFLRATSSMLASRFDDKLGLIRSWDSIAHAGNLFEPQFVVIIDNMMNLELLEWGSKNGGGDRLDFIARHQADSTDRHHFRKNGSAYHILSYNSDCADRIFGVYAGQGASVEGVWSRGQAWAIYGFSMMYRETGDPRYLARAEKAADYWMNEPHMPEDGIPYWDFSAIGEERDAAAAAVTASALLELSVICGDTAKAAVYRKYAVKTLLTLSSPEYFALLGENGDFLLKHSVGSKPLGSEVDVPLNYADYYYLEALLRYGRIVK